jgi:threonine dehydrogenase-like Zn-dependent dehydrogenase
MQTGRAAVLVEKNRIEQWDVKVFDPDPGGILIRVVLGGVCGTDVHLTRELADAYPLPVILGHEGVGRIEKLGSEIETDFASEPVKVGDLVYWSPKRACGRCYSCAVLDDGPCEQALFCGPASEPSWASHAEFAWLPRGMPFFRVPDGVPPEAVIALGCGLPTAVRGLDMTGPVQFGETVVVQGAGPVGLAATLIAKVSGAREIIVIDGSEERRGRAKLLGATATIALDESAEERRRRVHDLCGPAGPSVVVEAAGFLDAFPEGVDLAGKLGRYCVVGLFGAIGTSAIPPRTLTLKNLRIQAAHSPKPKHYYRALQLAAAMADTVPLADLVTHRFAISQEMEALEAVEAGRVVKAVIDPTLS